jgi:hypothetical protein
MHARYEGWVIERGAYRSENIPQKSRSMSLEPCGFAGAVWDSRGRYRATSPISGLLRRVGAGSCPYSRKRPYLRSLQGHNPGPIGTTTPLAVECPPRSWRRICVIFSRSHPQHQPLPGMFCPRTRLATVTRPSLLSATPAIFGLRRARTPKVGNRVEFAAQCFWNSICAFASSPLEPS